MRKIIKISVSILSIIVFVCNVSEGASPALSSISPDIACSLLSDIGLKTQGWQHYFDDSYGCKSQVLQFGTPKFFRNSFSYDVEGTSGSVEELILILSVSNIDEAAEAHQLFLQITQTLLKKLRNEPMPENMVDAVLHGKNYTLMNDRIHVEIKYSYWLMKSKKLNSLISKGYELRFIIR